jgi:hypothetical protein
MAAPPFDPELHESATLPFAAVAAIPVGAAGAVALTLIVKDLVFPAYKVVFVGVNVAVMVDDPAAIKLTVAPLPLALTVVDSVFELVYA